MDIVDVLQDLAFNTGHRIMTTREATKDTQGAMIVQMKEKGMKRLFFDHETKVFLGPERVEVDLYDSKSLNKIRGYLISPTLYEDDSLMLYGYQASPGYSVTLQTTSQYGYQNLNSKPNKTINSGYANPSGGFVCGSYYSPDDH